MTADPETTINRESTAASRWRLVFLPSANFQPYPDDVELHVLVTGRKKPAAIRRYLAEGWGLVRAERLSDRPSKPVRAINGDPGV